MSRKRSRLGDENMISQAGDMESTSVRNGSDHSFSSANNQPDIPQKRVFLLVDKRKILGQLSLSGLDDPHLKAMSHVISAEKNSPSYSCEHQIMITSYVSSNLNHLPLGNK
ncbi:hypothetical protein RR48_10963 [Papilio machaon]|uniref:Uncharacterized protein n=1 Tax=Papilio machaon TaxID=76193 RepID=A0A194R8F1_PAPMA|nr:hypothetical protein RR48_10963 [Papilio machaon]